MKSWKKDGRTLERRLMAKINNWDCFDGRSSHEIIVTLDSAVEDAADLCAAYYQNVSFTTLYFNSTYPIHGMPYTHRVKNLPVFRDHIYPFLPWSGSVLFQDPSYLVGMV